MSRTVKAPPNEETLQDLLRNLQGWAQDLEEMGREDEAEMIGNVAGRLERLLQREGITPAAR